MRWSSRRASSPWTSLQESRQRSLRAEAGELVVAAAALVVGAVGAAAAGAAAAAVAVAAPRAASAVAAAGSAERAGPASVRPGRVEFRMRTDSAPTSRLPV